MTLLRSKVTLPILLLQALIFLAIVSPPFVIDSILGKGEVLEFETSDDNFRKITYLIIFAIAVANLLGHRVTTCAAIGAVNPWLVIFLAYIGFSALSSAEVIISMKRAFLLLVTAIVSLSFVARSADQNGANDRLSGAVRPLVTILVAASLIYSASLPQIGITSDGAWRGLTFDKNTFGQVAALATILWMIALRESAVSFGYGVLMLAVSMLAVLLSQSTTSMVACLGVGFGLLVFHCFASFVREFTATDRPATGGAVCLLALLTAILLGHVLAVFLSFPAPLDLLKGAVSYFGKDLTLTGRTYLWQLMWDEIMRHPWFGVGYHAFWASLDPNSEFRTSFTGGRGYGHNGYLDILNELGIVGFILMMAVILSHTRNILLLHISYPRRAESHALLLLCALFLNFTETTLFQPTTLWSTIIMISVVDTSFAAAKLRKRELSFS